MKRLKVVLEHCLDDPIILQTQIYPSCLHGSFETCLREIREIFPYLFSAGNCEKFRNNRAINQSFDAWEKTWISFYRIVFAGKVNALLILTNLEFPDYKSREILSFNLWNSRKKISLRKCWELCVYISIWIIETKILRACFSGWRKIDMSSVQDRATQRVSYQII